MTTVERYDPTVDQWVEMASLLSVRVGCAAGVLDGYIYVTGGYDGAKCLNSVERYNCLPAIYSVPLASFWIDLLWVSCFNIVCYVKLFGIGKDRSVFWI